VICSFQVLFHQIQMKPKAQVLNFQLKSIIIEMVNVPGMPLRIICGGKAALRV